MIEANKRTKQRIDFKYRVYFGTSGTPYVGFIKNLSLTGIAIASKTVYLPGTELNLLINGLDSDVYTMGQVRWSNRKDKVLDYESIFDMGLEFLEYNADYEKLFLKLKDEFKEIRREPRFEKVFKVSFRTPKEMMLAYTENISLGGMFVTTSESLELKSKIDVEIEVTEINETIRVEGTVVFVADQAVADRIGIGPGVGLEITKYYDDGKAKFKDYMSNWMKYKS